MGEVVVPCTDLDATLGFFIDELGFKLERISPAEDPRLAIVFGHGLRLRLDRDADGDPGVIHLDGEGRARTAPNGTRIVLDPPAPLVVPALEPRFVWSPIADASWVTGRAGMRYRDLIPGRLGGRYIASHIVIEDGGEVPDYVHYHDIRFQMIFCYRGWVEVVYEDQGPPFRLEPGDCVLQAPRIRHRVLRSSPGLQVIEVTSPAAHDTFAEHEIELPTDSVDPDRDFGGQKFVRHRAASTPWTPWRADGFECRPLGIAQCAVVRGTPTTGELAHEDELQMFFVLAGRATLRSEQGDHAMREGDAVTIPAGMRHSLTECSSDLQWLDVRV